MPKEYGSFLWSGLRSRFSQPAVQWRMNISRVSRPPLPGRFKTFVEMFVARIKIMRLGREPFGETGGQVGFEETFRFLHHAFGDAIPA